MLHRLIIALILIIAVTLVPWWLYAIGVVYYATVYKGYEVVVLGVCIDTFYGSTTGVPFYTLLTSAMVLLAIFVRPYLYRVQ